MAVKVTSPEKEWPGQRGGRGCCKDSGSICGLAHKPKMSSFLSCLAARNTKKFLGTLIPVLSPKWFWGYFFRWVGEMRGNKKFSFFKKSPHLFSCLLCMCMYVYMCMCTTVCVGSPEDSAGQSVLTIHTVHEGLNFVINSKLANSCLGFWNCLALLALFPKKMLIYRKCFPNIYLLVYFIKI